MSYRIITGDALERLRELPDESVHCVVTSPPYWGLRDYGTAAWEGGDPECNHTSIRRGHGEHEKQASAGTSRDRIEGGNCRKCGAVRQDLQIGLEATPDEWCARLVEVFREVRRVLRHDGVFFLNIGDSYAGSWGNQGRREGRGTQRPINGDMLQPVHDGRYPAKESNTGAIPEGADLKPKDLVGQPWLLAFALRADGWYLRSEITWCKVNPMPESVRDRPTKATEKVFLFTKSARYYWDQFALAQAYARDAREALQYVSHGQAAIGVLSQEERPEQRGGVQGLFQGEDECLAADSERPDILSRDQQEVSREPRRRGQTSGLSEIHGWQGVPEAICDDGEGQNIDRAQQHEQGGQGSSEPALLLRQGQDHYEAIPRDGQGAGVPVAGSPQAPLAHDGRSIDSDSGRVAEHQGEPRERLHLLQGNGQAPDEGSSDPALEGRPARGPEHRACLSELQQPQGKPAPNARDFWIIATEPFKESHFAVFPQELVRRCILAGTSAKGVCPDCAAPWVRVVERTLGAVEGTSRPKAVGHAGYGATGSTLSLSGSSKEWAERGSRTITTGWRPSCTCDAGESLPATILDPFAGACTTLLAAERLGRGSIGIELSPTYAEMGENRIAQWRSERALGRDVKRHDPLPGQLSLLDAEP